MEGQIAINTGAAGGIGAATAHSLAALGARVLLTDIQQTEGVKVAVAIGENTHFNVHDVSNSGEWENVVRVAEECFGRSPFS